MQLPKVVYELLSLLLICTCVYLTLNYRNIENEATGLTIAQILDWKLGGTYRDRSEHYCKGLINWTDIGIIKHMWLAGIYHLNPTVSVVC